MPQDPIGWFHEHKKKLGIEKIRKQHHPSDIGHALLCYLLTQDLGMILTDHEPHEWIGNRQYNPDLELMWKSDCIVYCEVKCVDSSNQQQNYEAVKEQCYAGQQKNRRWNNILFVGFVVKGKELGFSICLGHCAKKFEQSIQGKCKTAEQLRLGI
ncbi:hypothetical protein BASA81_003352 [Batrachochytrium salamandrivorans]|nr:hypothetical protein BASA81_003352 [Batrachochytrium salamandrivorans]